MTVKRTILLMGILAYLLVALGPEPGLAICLGEGGRVTVKRALSDRCTEAEGQQVGRTGFYSAGSAADHCGDCVDILLVVQGSKHYSIRSRSVKQTTGVLPPTCSFVRHLDIRWHRSLEYGLLVSNPTIDLLRTVILLS